MSWLKKSSFFSVVFSYSRQQQQTISQSDCNVCWKVEFIWQPAITSSVAGPRSSSKALPKAKLAPEKVMVTVWWSAAHLSHYSLLNPGKTITPEKYAQQIDKMHWKLKCLQPALVSRKGPILSHNNVVMYGCESWTIKKAECQRIDAFELWCWRRLLRVPWTARRSNQSILKEVSPACSLEGLMLKLKLQYFGMWIKISNCSLLLSC